MIEPDDLRRIAEARTREASDHDPAFVASDSSDLVHELQVHQIELELQNEELRRANVEAESIRAEYAELYENAPVGYLSVDEHATITRANRTFATLLGRDPRELIGRSLADFLLPDSRTSFLRRFRGLFREPDDKHLDIHLRTEDGTERTLRLSANHAPESEGKPHRPAIRIAALDVTDQRRSEARVRDLLGQTELLFRELRHRTSNNYQLVLGMLSLQANATDDPAIVEALGRARHRVEAMMLVQEAIADTAHDARTDFCSYLERLIRGIVKALDPDGRVELDLRCDPPAFTDADTASSIGIIVNELVTNAWKHAFAHRPDGRLTVSFARTRDGWLLTVSDDGTRGSSPAAERVPSSGLGQTLIEALTDQLGAEYDRRTSTAGTRCELLLPEVLVTTA